MHDTPEKGVFATTSGSSRRAACACRTRDYVAWLLRSGEQQNVKLTQPVAVYWVYITVWATPDGLVHFRPDDIYQRDGARPGLVASAVPVEPIALPQE
jgi:L,D-transpeptidase YcbB